ncbi:MAG: high-affinity branched-chain amino acid ABC transporter permease LivM [Alphaproteobacteria bacterium]|nr:high-affinity branched-chain amino acid ABC transporter permease LivM [Alphaproteobacteria bacterium]
MTETSGRGAGTDVRAAIKEALVAAAVMAVLAVPLIGVELVDITGGVTLGQRFPMVAWACGIVFAGRLALALARGRAPASFGAALASPGLKAAGRRIGAWVGPALIGFAIVMPFLPFADRYIIDLGTSVLIYVMLGWGLNIVVGLAGLLDLGYVAFYAVGAYSFALLAQHLDLTFWECLPLAGLFAAMFGVLLGFPVLRLRGDYLAIVTLGFGEIIRIVLLNWQEFTGGPNGLSQIPRPTFLGAPLVRSAPEGQMPFHEFVAPIAAPIASLFGAEWEFTPIHRISYLYYIILLLALVTNFFTLRIRRLPVGRAWEALREDEIACRSLGINPTNTKLSAFALGAMFAGFAGSFFATRQGFISPESFTYIESAVILAIVVLGGMGSQLGVVIAAAFLILFPEFARDFAQYRMLLFGAAMVLVMVWRPQGLIAHREPSVLMHGRAKG